MNITKARAQYPVLTGPKPFIFADNAGGSQVPKNVVSRIVDYLLNTNVQLGADYAVSQVATRRVMVEGPTAAKILFNAESPDEIVLGASSTLNIENLAHGLAGDVKAGDEIIITGEHEANGGPWKHLAARVGAIIKTWPHRQVDPANPYAVALVVDDLLPLITPKTRLVAFTATSNVLGSVVPVKDVVRAVRDKAAEAGSPKVEVCVDAVAYAPHKKIDVRAWDVDYCVFSCYKIYGPHVSALYVRAAALKKSVSSIVHHFLQVPEVAYKIMPGGPGYEGVYAITGIIPYLLSLTPDGEKLLSETSLLDDPGADSMPLLTHASLPAALDGAWAAIAAHELMLMAPLLGFLTHPDQWARGVRIAGDGGGFQEDSSRSVSAPFQNHVAGRAPTVSFVLVESTNGKPRLRSKEVVEYFDKKGGIGIRYGHFYAYTLVSQLSPCNDPADGVIRISLVHYNTVEEVQRIIEVLKEVLA
ncbi:pyridoxal phosphate-dependent transferase [Schizophyllum fasciatum]